MSIQTEWAQETIRLSRKYAPDVEFQVEVRRLLLSGAIDTESGCSRAILFGVALENIADNYLRGDRKKKEYLNLKRF